jgi:regulator of RNase E activity RraB
MTQKSDDWQYYEATNKNRETCVTLVNLALDEQPELHDSHQWLILILVPHADANKPGGLKILQQRIVNAVAKCANTYFVARVDKPTASELWLYADHQFDVKNALRDAGIDANHFGVDIRQDSQWTAYRMSLLPQTENQWKQALNGRVLAELKRHGDDPGVAHVIYHTLFLRSTEDLQKCLPILERHGFKLLGTKQTDSRELKLIAEFTQELPKLTLQLLNEATINLVNLADSLKGKYDGWQTKVMKAN